MTLKILYEALEETGLPVSYDHFEKPTKLPYIVYTAGREDNFNADNQDYQEIISGEVELYTEKKEPETEENLKTVLRNLGGGFVFKKNNEIYISQEDMFVQVWTFQMIGED